MRKRERQRSTSLTLVLWALFLASFGWLQLSAVAASPMEIEDPPASLAEIRKSRRLAILIKRSSVVNASESDDPIIDEALSSDPRESLKYRRTYIIIANKLNSYIRKYRSIRAVHEIAKADFIVYFKLVEYRRLLNGIYPYGELFIIANSDPAQSRPARVVWKTKKVMFAEDAIKDFLKELRGVRQEQ